MHEVATAYGKLEHTPNRSDVKRAYRALMSELWAQFRALPVRVRFTDSDPYRTSSELFIAADAGEVRVFRGATLPVFHPFTTVAPNGELYNSVFRAVHDVLAHYPGRHGFGARGELAAFQVHARLLSPIAIHAIATETLGQNAWFNYGPFAHLPASTRPFAPQMADLLPWHLIETHLS